MDLLHVMKTRARIEGDMVMVDEFLNHRVEPEVIAMVGRDIATFVTEWNADIILTAEASGIPPALACGLHMGIPIIYAKKYVHSGRRRTIAMEVASPTKGIEYRLEVAQDILEAGKRVAIVDDFLAGGRTAEALGQIVVEAGSHPVGFAFAIEKQYTHGRRRLEAHGWKVRSLVKVTSVDNGELHLLQ